MNRRDFLHAGIGATLTGGTLAALDRQPRLINIQSDDCARSYPPAYSVIPVVGDGRWTWIEPPEGETGYLEPRPYDLSVGIQLEGTGDAANVTSTTAAPLDYPEQKIESVKIETVGCQAKLRKLTDGAGQLVVSAAELARGQVAKAVARYRLTLFKQYHGYTADHFPAKQKIPPEVRKQFLQDSPGIQTRSRQVRELAAELTSGTPKHPWEQVKSFADWIPNHTWAEFFLVDNKGEGRWIPAHTACYSWFGWNGVHELVLQKGDRIQLPEKKKLVRLLADWTQWSGAQPKASYTAELTPQPIEPGGDAGPGARRKDEKGEWKVVGGHSLDRYVRR